VRHRGRARSTDDDRHVEAVVGESGGGTGHTEGLSQRVPGLLAEDGVHQLDDLVLWRKTPSNQLVPERKIPIGRKA